MRRQGGRADWGEREWLSSVEERGGESNQQYICEKRCPQATDCYYL